MTTTAPVIPPAAAVRTSTGAVLSVEGISKAYRRGIWPLRRTRQVLRGVDLSLRPGEVAGGRRAKLDLGPALLADPDLRVLDEPYAGFDWDTYQKFWGLVAARRAAGRTVLIVSHFVVDEQRFDRIVAIRDGKAVPR